MNQFTKFTLALSLTAGLLFPIPAYSSDTESICLIEVLFQNKAVTTYRAICCPGQQQLTFQGLPDLNTGTGCSGDHCHKLIKVAIETEIEIFIETIANSQKTAERDADIESLESLSRQIKSGQSMTAEQVKELQKILDKYQLKPTGGIGRANLPIIATQGDPKDPQKKRIIIQGFESDLERFGYDDDPMDCMTDDEVKGCLQKNAKFMKCCYAEFKHPKTQREIIAQIVLCESEGHNVPGTTDTFLKKKFHAFGFQIKELPKTIEKSDVYKLDAADVFFPKKCDRHCLMLQLGNIIAGVTLAEHRIGKFSK